MNKYNFICKGCNKKKSPTKPNKSGFCVKCFSIETQTGIKRPQFSRENSKRWKGGEYVSTDGYKMVKAEGETHPSGRQKYKKEHILIYEKFSGEELKTQAGNMGQQIHHIDGDKLNNNIENLVFCENTREHRNFHCQLEEIALQLVRENIIIFDKKDNKYKINESRIT